jgi:formylmethanofuran dehydrogenase subunit B
MAELRKNNAGALGNSLHVDVPCAFCGCLCDDLRVRIAGGQVVELDGACFLARPQILAAGASRPAGRIAGRETSRAEAIHEAARVLKAARAPLVWGLGRATCEAQAAAVEIAQLLGGVIAVPSSDDALQAVGEVSCTLGEMRQRGDLIVAWGVDPLTTHPRLLQRHAPAGLGVTVVDSRATATTAAANRWLQIQRGRGFEAATVLRALLKNAPFDEAQVAERTGVAPATWRELLDRMKQARYGVLLSTPNFGSPAAEALAVARLIRELNDHTRWVRVPLLATVNSAGASSVLAWRTGFSHGIDFTAANSSASSAGMIQAERLLARGEVDAALMVCDDPSELMSVAAQKHLAAIPTIVIDSRETALWQQADVVLTAALPGIEAAGTMFRMDGVPLALRRVMDSPLAGDFELLRALAAAIRAGREGNALGEPGG